MSYEPTTWKKGDKVTSTKLNKIEQGIQGNDSDIDELKSGFTQVENVLELSESAYVFVNSVEEMTDYSKNYVLRSNNHIYTAQESEGDPVDEFSIDTVNHRIYTGDPGGTSANGYFTTGKIPIDPVADASATLTLANTSNLYDRYGTGTRFASSRLVFYDANGNRIVGVEDYYLGDKNTSASDIVKFDYDSTKQSHTVNLSQITIPSNCVNIAMCWAISSVPKATLAEADLPAITVADVKAKNYGIYISTHASTGYTFVDTGAIYTPSGNAITRLDSEINSVKSAVMSEKTTSGTYLIITGATEGEAPTSLTVEEPCTVYMSNKNLLDVFTFNGGGKYIAQVDAETGAVEMVADKKTSATWSIGSIYYSPFAADLKAGDYVLSIDLTKTTGHAAVVSVNVEGNTSIASSDFNDSVTHVELPFTIDADKTVYVNIKLYNGVGTIQIERGSVSTPYAKYEAKQSLTITDVSNIDYQSLSFYGGQTNVWNSTDNQMTLGYATFVKDEVENLDARVNAIESGVVTKNNIITRNKDVEDVAKYSAEYGVGYRGTPHYYKQLSMLITTDLHSCWDQLKSAVKYLNYLETLDMGVCLGDIIVEKYTNPSTGYDSAVALAEKPWLTIIGNHDCGNSTTKVSDCGTTAQVVTKYITPNESKMGMSGLTTPYYAYRNDEHKIEFICLYNYDSPETVVDGAYEYARGRACYSQRQIDWLISTLNSVPSDYAVVIMSHEYTEPNTPVECDWTQWNVEHIGSNTNNGGYGTSQIISEILNAWKNGTTFSSTFTPTVAVLPTITVSCDFSARGAGEFICYVIGHTHKDIIAKNNKYPDQIIVSTGATAIDEWQNSNSDLPRVFGAKSEDLITVMSFDRRFKRINLVRIGSNKTITMVDRTMISIPYAT